MPDPWDDAASRFDDEPDHGLRDPVIRAAWQERLRSWLPPAPATVLDLGCGTGTLTLLLHESGYHVVGADLSMGMLAVARRKLPRPLLVRADAGRPPFAAKSFDVVLARHVVWALPDPVRALQRWSTLADRLVLVEGRWHTGAGLSASELTGMLEPHGSDVRVEPLDDPTLWAGKIGDERYAVLATRGSRPVPRRRGR
jgi:SAM-dependent methyltransferase